jgi:hypothetical protein
MTVIVIGPSYVTSAVSEDADIDAVVEAVNITLTPDAVLPRNAVSDAHVETSECVFPTDTDCDGSTMETDVPTTVTDVLPVDGALTIAIDDTTIV